MARPNKKQHTIPRIYLQAFTDSTGRVWVADERLNLYQQKPENILTEQDYYAVRFPSGGGTLNIETKYLNGIEGDYADIYRDKLSQQKPITKEEKARLAIFIASMMERHKGSRRSLEKFAHDIKEKVAHLRALPDSAKKRMAMTPSITSGSSISATDLLKELEDVGSLHASLIPETVEGIAPIIFEMDWAFFKRSEGSEIFITSDNPCTMIDPVAENEIGIGKIGSLPGLAYQNTELTLPVSPDLAIFCSWLPKKDCEYIKMDSDYVADLNRRTRRGSRTLVSSEKAILEKILTKKRAQ